MFHGDSESVAPPSLSATTSWPPRRGLPAAGVVELVAGEPDEPHAASTPGKLAAAATAAVRCRSARRDNCAVRSSTAPWGSIFAPSSVMPASALSAAATATKAQTPVSVAVCTELSGTLYML